MAALAVAGSSWIRRKRQLELSPAILVEGEDLCREREVVYVSLSWRGLGRSVLFFEHLVSSPLQ